MLNLKHIILTLFFLFLLTGCGLSRINYCYKTQRVCQDQCLIESQRCRDHDQQCYLELTYCLDQKE